MKEDVQTSKLKIYAKKCCNGTNKQGNLIRTQKPFPYSPT